MDGIAAETKHDNGRLNYDDEHNLNQQQDLTTGEFFSGFSVDSRTKAKINLTRVKPDGIPESLITT